MVLQLLGRHHRSDARAADALGEYSNYRLLIGAYSVVRVPGDAESKERLLRTLTQDSFPHLVADILHIIHHHRDVQVVDGPGDGRRDIHSITPSGERHVTQCKYHANLSKSVGSQETDELVVALHKFGVTNGVFATTGRFSPQARREFLDNFKNFSLSLLQGTDIVDAVLTEPLLTAAWYDGQGICKIRHTLVIPVIARSIKRDAPIELSLEPSVLRLNDTLEMSIRPKFVNRTVFEPYRSPRNKTIWEQWLPQIQAYQCSFRGDTHLYGMPTLLTDVLPKLLLQRIDFARESIVALRTGKSHFTLLGGVGEGTTVPTEDGPVTFFAQNESTFECEEEWFLPWTDTGKWEFCWDGRATTAGWARWYHPLLDTCLNLMLVSPHGAHSQGQWLSEQAYLTKWWNESLHMVGTKAAVEGFCTKLGEKEQPSEIYAYGPNGAMISWLHGNLGEGFHSMVLREDPDSDDADDPISEYEAAVAKGFAKVKKRLKARGAKAELSEVSGPIARHIAAADGKDPIPDIHLTEYRPSDLLTLFGDLPSPINPEGRRFVFERVWIVKDEIAQVEAFLRSTSVAVQVGEFLWEAEKGPSSDKTYVFASLELPCPSSTATRSFLDGADQAITDGWATVEAALTIRYRSAVPGTRDYWYKEIGLPLLYD